MLLAVGVLLVLAGAVLVLGGRAERDHFQKLRTVRCADAPPSNEEVKLSARAVCATPLIAPVSQKPCALYRLVLEYMDPYDDRESADRKQHQATTERYAADLALQDDTGTLPLDLQGARYELVHCVSTQGGGLFASVEMERLADQLLPSRNYRPGALYEYRLAPDEPVLAIGRIVRTRSGKIFSAGDGRLELWGGGGRKKLEGGAGADVLGYVLALAGVACAAFWLLP